MTPARLYVKERGKSEFTQNNGTYTSGDDAYADGVKMCEIGTIVEFEVWSRDGAYKAGVTIERTDEIDGSPAS
jgi:hypothetical protein